MLLAWGRGNGTKRKIVSNSPYEGEPMTNIIQSEHRCSVLAQGSHSRSDLHLRIRTGQSSLRHRSPAWSGHVQLHANVLLPFSSASVSEFRTVARVLVLAPSGGSTPASRKCHSARFCATISLRAQSDDRNPPHSPRRVSNACAGTTGDSLLSGWLRNQISITSSDSPLPHQALLIAPAAPSNGHRQFPQIDEFVLPVRPVGIDVSGRLARLSNPANAIHVLDAIAQQITPAS